MKSLINKVMKNSGETSSHLIKTFFVYGFIALSMIIIKILIARFYGQEELGIFTYFFSLVSLVFLFTSFGLPEAIAQTVIKDKLKLKSLLRKYIPLIISTTSFFMILTILITSYFNFNPNIPFFNTAIVVYIVIYTLFYTTYSILRGFKKFVDASIYSLVGRIFFVAFIIVGFLLSYNITFILIIFSLTLVISTLFSLPQLKRLTKNIVVKTSLRKFVYLAVSLFLMQVGFYSLRFLSEIIIGYMVDFNSLGLYSAHSSITNVIRLIAYVFPVVVLPMAVVNKFKLKNSIIKITKLLIPFSLLTLVGAYVLVPFLYGNQYQHLSLPIYLVVSSSLLIIYSYVNSVFVGENKFSGLYLKIIGFDFILSLIANSLLNIYFILKMGIIGAPIATALTIILKIILNIYAIRKLRVNQYGNRTKIQEKIQ